MKKQWTKRLLAGVATLALALPIAFGLGQHTVKAAEGDPAVTPAAQNVVLTKFGFDQAPTPDKHDTTQAPADALKGWAAGATPLEGVQFEVYDVTSEYWSNPTGYAEDSGNKPAISKGTAVTAKDAQGNDQTIFTTDSNGQITWNLPTISTDATGKTHNAVYVFHEVQSRTGYKATSEDFMLSLPTADLGTVYVYPKNQKDSTFQRYFHKIDGETKNDLAGAKFVIQKDTQFLQLMDVNKNPWTPTTDKDKSGFIDTEKLNLRFNWVDDQKDATTFTSDSNGEFGLNGFDDTDTSYTAVETQEPAGYSKQNADFKATDTKDAIEIKDMPKHLLPHTGGAGILAILAVGSALIALAFVGIRKRQARA